jgi:hypothetical protein
VRFVHLFDWGWDFHGTNPAEDIRDGLTKKAATVDRPAAALIATTAASNCCAVPCSPSMASRLACATPDDARVPLDSFPH